MSDAHGESGRPKRVRSPIVLNYERAEQMRAEHRARPGFVRELAQRHGVSEETARAVLKRQIWREPPQRRGA